MIFEGSAADSRLRKGEPIRRARNTQSATGEGSRAELGDYALCQQSSYARSPRARRPSRWQVVRQHRDVSLPVPCRPNPLTCNQARRSRHPRDMPRRLRCDRCSPCATQSRRPAKHRTCRDIRSTGSPAIGPSRHMAGRAANRGHLGRTVCPGDPQHLGSA